MLSEKEIKHYKKKHGYKEFSFYLRYIEALKKWRFLPTNFILNVLRNSEDLPTNKETTTGSNRTLKRQIQKQLGNRAIKVFKGN